LVRTGRIEEPGFLGIFKRQRELSVEERYTLVGEMVAHYDQIIHALTQGRDVYLAFLEQIEAGLGRALEHKLQDYANFAQDLQRQEATARGKDRRESVEALVKQQEELRQYLKVTTQAGLLILKKIENIRKSILSLVDDQGRQSKLLETLKEDLGEKRQIYINQKRLHKMRQEAQLFAQVAIEFESYLKDYFGPLQGLLHEVGRVDEGLAKTVGEIQALTAQLQEGRAALLTGQGEDRVLDLLVSADLKRDQMSRLLSTLGTMEGELQEVEAELITGTKSGVVGAVETVQAFFRAALQRSEQGSEPAHALAMVRVPAGTFLMGSPEGEAGRCSGESQRPVTITRDFLMAKTPMTVGQWNALVAASQGLAKPGDANVPVVEVSWFDAVWACNELSAREGLAPSYELVGMTGAPGDGLRFTEVRLLGLHRAGYRLPTEAEWEYACRAGTQGPHYLEPLDQIAWYRPNCSSRMSVARKLPNDWGLYDTLGNVWEWTWDWYGPPQGPPEQAPLRDPEGPKRGAKRVSRGGCFSNGGVSWLRAADRGRVEPAGTFNVLGFRCARSCA
jgi:formylglycine-generating enzyme required for sulfatase activity